MTEQNKINPALYTSASEALKLAKITMMMQKDTAFYTALLFSLKQQITDTVPTAATDGRHLLLNPEFFMNLTMNERIGLLAHEVLHVALDHMHRCEHRDPQLWNVAGDYVINGFLLKAGYHLPDGGLHDIQYDNMSTEQVYALLSQQNQQQQQAQISQCAMDVAYPDQAQNPNDAVTKDEVTNIILRATTQAKMMGQPAGSIPGEAEIQLQQTLNPPLPWNVILSHYLTEFAKDDYTFKRPNRRFLPDYYLPSAHSEAICNLAVCVDTSSSVTDAQFNDFITKIYEIQKTMHPQKITVMAFNTAFVSEQVLKDGDNPFTALVFKGRGGTRIRPAHEWIAKNKPTVALIFTDGEFTEVEPDNKSIPLIWLIYNNPKWQSQFGRTIHYNINDK